MIDWKQINRSIVIDPTYEKAYYRKLQILRDAGRLEEAVSSIPIWLKNKEINELHKEIKEEYLNSMGIDQLLNNLSEKNQENMELIKQGHLLFFRRYQICYAGLNNRWKIRVVYRILESLDRKQVNTTMDLNKNL